MVLVLAWLRFWEATWKLEVGKEGQKIGLGLSLVEILGGNVGSEVGKGSLM